MAGPVGGCGRLLGGAGFCVRAALPHHPPTARGPRVPVPSPASGNAGAEAGAIRFSAVVIGPGAMVVQLPPGLPADHRCPPTWRPGTAEPHSGSVRRPRPRPRRAPATAGGGKRGRRPRSGGRRGAEPAAMAMMEPWRWYGSWPPRCPACRCTTPTAPPGQRLGGTGLFCRAGEGGYSTVGLRRSMRTTSRRRPRWRLIRSRDTGHLRPVGRARSARCRARQPRHQPESDRDQPASQPW